LLIPFDVKLSKNDRFFGIYTELDMSGYRHDIDNKKTLEKIKYLDSVIDSAMKDR
jgi:hypothetical protein